MLKLFRYGPRRKALMICILLAVNFLILFNVSQNSEESSQPVFADKSVSDRFIEQYRPKWSEVLSAGIPGMDRMGNRKNVKISTDTSVGQVFRDTVFLVTGMDIYDMRSAFNMEIPLVRNLSTGTPIVSAMSLPNFPQFNPQSLLAGDSKPLVGIYHTHTSETFIPSSGLSHVRGGQKGQIVDVGLALRNRLEADGIRAVHSDNVHDYPSFMKAYGVSEVTAKKMLEDYPSIQMIFDIHRDADKRENTIVNVNGIPAARILIVVATGQPDLPQPHWQQNHAFAKLIDAKLNAHFPGLSRGIQLVDWRYNQHLHSRALLFEVGSQECTLEEEERAMEMLADVIAEIIAENKE